MSEIKFVYCNKCGGPTNHIILSNDNYECMVCKRERPPLVDLKHNNPNTRKVITPVVTVIPVSVVEPEVVKKGRGRPKKI